MDIIEHPPIFRIPSIPDQVLYMWIVMGILLVVAVVATRRLQLVPRGSQNFMEIVLEQFVRELDETIGHGGRRYLPLIATLGLFILTSNLMGLVPGLIAPTANLNTTAACALIVFFTYHWIGVRKQGLVPYLKHFAGPVPLAAQAADVRHRDHQPLRAAAVAVAPPLRQHDGGPHPARHLLLHDGAGRDAGLGALGLARRDPGGSAGDGHPGRLRGRLPASRSRSWSPLIQTFIFCKLAMLYIAAAVEETEHH